MLAGKGVEVDVIGDVDVLAKSFSFSSGRSIGNAGGLGIPVY